MPKPCTICSSEYRATIDAQLLDGVKVATLARNPVLGASSDALYRHARAHLTPSLGASLSDGLDQLDLFGHLEAGLRDVARVCERAAAQGSASLLLRAAAARVSVVRAIQESIPEGEGLDLIQAAESGQALAQAVVRVAYRNPPLALELAGELDAAPELQDSLRQWAVAASLNQQEK